MKFPSLLSKRSLGIDIGTSSIKVVELSSFAGRIKLENYAQVSSKVLYQKPFRTFERNTLLLSTQEISKTLKAIFEEAKIKPKKVYFSIPDYASFFTTFELPPMTQEEISFAVEAEARRHIPVPIPEVTWDWQLIGKKQIGKKYRFKILLVAVPKEVVAQYQTLAATLNLESIFLEAEVFSLARSLVEKKSGIVGIIDIGARTTTCSIIERGVLKISHSFDLSGNEMRDRIAKSLGIDHEKAEELKTRYGLIQTSTLEGKEIKNILAPLVDLILEEVNRTFSHFFISEGKEVEKIILAGGEANLPGLLLYSQNYFKKEVEIANPFKKIYFPPILEETLKEMGPSFAIAVGLAQREFE
jgi:type IV pilus assembly protein PilM